MRTVTKGDGVNGASDRITMQVAAWPGVMSLPHRFGGVEFRYGRRELGHLHGDRMLDLPLTRAQRDQLITEGRVVRHQWLPDSGWVTRHIRDEDDEADALALLRAQYERAVAVAERRGSATEAMR